jgi:hypothetical protein
MWRRRSPPPKKSPTRSPVRRERIGPLRGSRFS